MNTYAQSHTYMHTYACTYIHVCAYVCTVRLRVSALVYVMCVCAVERGRVWQCRKKRRRLTEAMERRVAKTRGMFSICMYISIYLSIYIYIHTYVTYICVCMYESCTYVGIYVCAYVQGP